MEQLPHTGGTPAWPFFISYAYEDIHYVKRLAAYLREARLPTWFDADLKWGGRWSRRRSEQIRRAPAIIVVMSRAAAESEWVERDILEGQRTNRPFRPILLGGDRHFLLAATQFFDARAGRLPGAREIQGLHRLLESEQPGPQPMTLIDWGQVAGDSDKAGQERETGELLAQLQAFLRADRVEHADILTTSIVLGAAGRLVAGWLHEADGALLPPGLIAGIDRVWSVATRGVQGFRTQLALYDAPPADVQPGHERDFTALARAVGWKGLQRGSPPRYADFVTSSDGSWPLGFFPTLRNPQLEIRQGWYDRWVRTAMAVHLRLRSWERSL